MTGGEPTAITKSTADAIFAVSFFPTDDRVLITRDQAGNELNHLYVIERDGAITNPQGINIDALRGHIRATGGVKGFIGGDYHENGLAMLEQECDILIPAAVESVIHADNAERIADMLTHHPAVSRVLFPGLPEHPGHEVAAKQMRRFGGMVSFLLADGRDAALKVCASTELFTLAESLGAVESLIEHPAAMTHASAAGSPLEVPDNLVRLSVGIESSSDLVADLADALRGLLARGRDPLLDQAQELVENRVLDADRQRQDAVEPALDRREVLDQYPALALQLETRARLEVDHGGALELALGEEIKPGDQRCLGIFALEVVGRVEQVLPARLPLPAGERAQAVEAACDGAGEAQLALAVGGHRTEQWRRCLMGAVGPAEPLDRAIGAPARLKQEVDALLLIFDVEAGVIRAPGPARV